MKEAQSAAGENLPCWNGTISDISSFEKGLFSLAYFGGENELDGFLLSLLHLIDSSESLELEDKRTVLYSPANLYRRGQKLTGLVGDHFKKISKRRDFNVCQFFIKNSLPLDLVGGKLPLLFDDIMLTRHALKLAWAFLLTMRLNRLDNFPFFQRIRRIKVRKSSQIHQRS